MKPLKAALALSLTLILAGLNAGCSRTEIRGTITELEYEKSKEVCKSKPRKCKSVECWEIDITDDAGVEHEICVSENTWKKYRVGDRYPS